METYHIVSSNIAAVAYHRGKLRVAFNSGSTYEYDRAPYTLFRELASADSAGQYFHRHVRGKFPYRKLPESSLR